MKRNPKKINSDPLIHLPLSVNDFITEVKPNGVYNPKKKKRKNKK